MEHKIIVPVDFSSTSQNAYLYARELAKVFNKTIEVVHVFFGDYNHPKTTDAGSAQNIEEEIQKRLDEFIDLYPSTDDSNVLSKVIVKTRIVRGFIVKSIINISSQPDTFMVVMGSTGEHDLLDKLIGRISSEVAQKAKCPVLLVPKGAKYFTYNNILYASNYESADRWMLDKIIKFNGTFNAALHFINVSKKDKKVYFQIVENEIFETLFKDGDPSFSFNLATINYPSVMSGLFQYTVDNNIDLIVLVNQQRGIIESTLGQSITKKMALNSHTPLLVYHLPE